MCIDKTINKDNMDIILKELGKRFRKLNGNKTPAEIVLVGGAAIIASYGFRGSTSDIDAIISASSALKEAAATTGDTFGLENNWLNGDFQRTSSFSTQLVTHSKYYRTFSNILQVRVVTGPYLLATKLVAGRDFKNDLSDIVGIMVEQKQRGEPITFENVNQALHTLYNGWDRVKDNMKSFFHAALNNDDLEGVIEQVRQLEVDQNEELRQDIEQPAFELKQEKQLSIPSEELELPKQKRDITIE